jgi:L-fucose isomerase-like protein
MSTKGLRSKIKLVCVSRAPGIPGWPHVDFDYESLAQQRATQLRQALPHCDFTVVRYGTPQEARAGFADNRDYDGVVLCNAAHGIGVINEFLDLAQPGVIIDELYSGSGDSIRANTRIRKQKLPVVLVASSNFQDAADAVRLLHVRKSLSASKIVVFKNFDPLSPAQEEFLKTALGTGSTWKRYLAGPSGFQEKVDRLQELFGAQVVVKSKQDLEDYLRDVNEEEAAALAEQWVRGAQAVLEPTRSDVLESAKMYLALRQAVREEAADAVSVDCIMMFYTTGMPAYPCMSHSKMCDEGTTAVCESDLDSTLTQLAMKYITGRAGFVSDPVIDTALNQIVYAHCCAATRWYGEGSTPQPYILRDHAEDHKSTAIQTIMPVGDVVTTVKFDIMTNALAIHNGVAVGNVNDPKGCRTKLAVKVPDARRLLDNWDADVFSWHKVTCYGDYRKDFLNLARIYGCRVIEEDAACR